MDFVAYTTQRSPFMRWFVPIGFSVIAAQWVWSDTPLSWVNAAVAVLALIEWVRFALWRRRLRLRRTSARLSD